MTSKIHAVFPDGAGVREASLKLQALRAELVHDGSDGSSSLTATIGDECVDLAIHMITQTGGTMEV